MCLCLAVKKKFRLAWDAEITQVDDRDELTAAVGTARCWLMLLLTGEQWSAAARG